MNVGFLIFPGLEELDLVGPWEMAGMSVLCSKGMSLNPHVDFADCPALDYLLVPGGEGTRKEVDNPELIRFVAYQARHCKAVLSVCTGAFILHRAGLLPDCGPRHTGHPLIVCANLPM